jgi:hypothetical protein
MRVYDRFLISAIALLATCISTAAQADTYFGNNCSRPEAGGGLPMVQFPCLMTANYALVFSPSAQSNLKVDFVDEYNIQLSADVDVSSPVFYGDSFTNFNQSTSFGRFATLVLADGYELVSGKQKAIGTKRTITGYSDGTPDKTEVASDELSVDVQVHPQRMSEIVGPGSGPSVLPLGSYTQAFQAFTRYWTHSPWAPYPPEPTIYSDTHYSKLIYNVAIRAVPEPATWVYLCLGLLGVGFSMKRHAANGR